MKQDAGLTSSLRALDCEDPWVATASKAATFAEVLRGKRKPSKEQKECYLLKRLPRDIRDAIWELLFLRPCGIVPGLVHSYSYSPAEWTGSRRIPSRESHTRPYSYHWDEIRLRYYENEHRYEPPRFLHPLSFNTTWTTLPTREEKDLIDQGATTLPSSIDKETGETIHNVIFKQDNDFIEVIYQKIVTVSGFDGIRVMRTCTTFHDEVANMLYGRNLFVFDARGNATWQSHRAEGNAQQFESLRFRIPGLEDEHGRTPTSRQVKCAIGRIFDKKSYLPIYAWEDPLLRFCYEVGRKNVQRLTKIKIEGHLQVCARGGDNRQPAGLGRLMQIYTPILREVARDLRSLTLHIGFDQECVNMSKVFSRGEMVGFNLVEGDDACGDEGKSDEEKLHSIVGRMVRELRVSKHIQLGDYKQGFRLTMRNGESLLDGWKL